jgi:DNA modification methylase
MTTPYYDDGQITIYCGDCRDVLPTLAENSADLILTDPPYNVGKAAWDDNVPMWWLNDAARIAPTLGVMPGVVNLVAYPPEIGRLRYRWTLAAHLVNGMTRGAIGYGNWIPCLVYAADGVSLYRRTSDVGRIAIGRSKKPDHPSPKPLEVMQWLVDILPGQTILDPFMGSGTTILAAQQRGRRAIGIEQSEAYCDLAVRRLQQAVLPLEIPA